VYFQKVKPSNYISIFASFEIKFDWIKLIEQNAVIVQTFSALSVSLSVTKYWRRDIQQKDTHHKDIQHNGTLDRGLFCDTQHNNNILSVPIFYFFYCYSECRYAECHYVDCRGAKSEQYMFLLLALPCLV
jgi:hypothetical protein